MEAENKRTKLSIIVYLLLTFALSSIFYFLVIRRANAGQSLGLLILGLMWCPGVSGIATRLIFQGNLRGHGFGWGKTKYQFASYWIPLAYASAVYLPIWFAGYFNPASPMLDTISHRFPNLPHAAVLALFFAILATVGVLSSCISALGEELGWRGFLVPQLAKIVPFNRVAMISGVIWALWHYPIILFSTAYRGAGPLWYTVACFTVMVVSMSFLFAWMRLKSGSVWTGMLLHASHNLFIQAFFDPQTRHARISDLWTTEFGAGLAIVSIIVALVVANKSSELPPPEGSAASAT
jgi:membrane protease YdiL (CAAX protease family)